MPRTRRKTTRPAGDANGWCAAAALCNRPLPLVPLDCRDPQAKWFGKWHFNADTEWVKSIGGPFDTRDEAVAAALATGLFTLRPGMDSPHLDRIEPARTR